MDSKYCARTKASIAGKSDETSGCDTDISVEWFNTACEFPENKFKSILFVQKIRDPRYA